MASRTASTAREEGILEQHIARLKRCRRCPRMLPPPVSGGPVVSRIILVGQAPGVREPVLGRPFAWTAGKTLFRWLSEFCDLTEDEARARIYFAAVCRCFPGKSGGGTDRVPSPEEVRNCSTWMAAEFEILEPRLVLPVGKLAIGQFLAFEKLSEIIGKKYVVQRQCHRFDVIPLPHPSGASPWHKMSPGRELTADALREIARHPEIIALRSRRRRQAESLTRARRGVI